MKRKRKTLNCVCSATPSGDVSVTDSILLNRIVENGMAQIKKTENPRKAAAMGLYLGDLCEKKGWSMRALDIWFLTLNHVEDIDDRLTWGSWEEGSRRNEIIPALGCYFDHRTSEEDCRQIALRIDRLWRKTGHPELAKATKRIRRDYCSMWYDIYYTCLP